MYKVQLLDTFLADRKRENRIITKVFCVAVGLYTVYETWVLKMTVTTVSEGTCVVKKLSMVLHSWVFYNQYVTDIVARSIAAF